MEAPRMTFNLGPTPYLDHYHDIQFWWPSIQDIVPSASAPTIPGQSLNSIASARSPVTPSRCPTALFSNYYDQNPNFNPDLIDLYAGDLLPDIPSGLNNDCIDFLNSGFVHGTVAHDDQSSSPLTSIGTASSSTASVQSFRSPSPVPRLLGSHDFDIQQNYEPCLPESSSSTGRRKPLTTSYKNSSSAIYAERIRERNRLSAQRFRDKKKADAFDLEVKTQELTQQREELVEEITRLQWQSIMMFDQCLRTRLCRCEDVRDFFRTNANQHSHLCISRNTH